MSDYLQRLIARMNRPVMAPPRPAPGLQPAVNPRAVVENPSDPFMVDEVPVAPAGSPPPPATSPGSPAGVGSRPEFRQTTAPLVEITATTAPPPVGDTGEIARARDFRPVPEAIVHPTIAALPQSAESQPAGFLPEDAGQGQLERAAPGEGTDRVAPAPAAPKGFTEIVPPLFPAVEPARPQEAGPQKTPETQRERVVMVVEKSAPPEASIDAPPLAPPAMPEAAVARPEPALLQPPAPPPVTPAAPAAEPRVIIGRLQVEVVPAPPPAPPPRPVAVSSPRPAAPTRATRPVRSMLRFGLGQL